ncbi:hypothetical protein CNMCM5793_009684 [Aspergillus hiratsukae]|uniref:Uncharacterized protein n=1 Tax=Aspergillus hiratsukae TaxID=1194566 RepID=A0A8H6P0U8_9EURO|nr:hypothetical protein CNMCM5793_009684 [Aspergillus hiratsukae]KAF7156170.1 hypothetical protein CNMCM6106_009235 [Aspergillus hiratsukae]
MGPMADLNLPPALKQESRMMTLPYEIVLLVAELLSLRSWNALARTCRHLYSVLTPSLYSIAVSIKNGQGDVFKWAAGKGRLATIHRLMDYALEGYVDCVRGECALRQAATAGQTDIIHWLLDYGVDPYCTQTRDDDFGSLSYIDRAPPVVIAARSGHTEAAKLLLDVMTDLDYVRSLEESPVFGLVLGKQTALLETILCRGINVDQRDVLGRTALFHAVEHEHILGVTLLLEFGADINASDNYQITPLYIAAERGLEAVIELLLQRGAQVDMKAYGSHTSLDAAITANSIKAVSLLIEHGANVNVIDSFRKTTLGRSLSDGIEAGILKLLLDAGADFTAPTLYGLTPVKLAWMKGDKEKVRLLLDAIEARGAASDLLESPTPVLHAGIFTQHDLAYRLLAQGANVGKPERTTGWTVLMEAAKQEEDSLFDLVLQKSLNVDAVDPLGRTALSFAAEQGSEHKVRSLLKKNASDFASIPGCDTTLTYAARNHYLQVVLLLLQQAKGVDLADDSLRSAVTSAVAFGDAQFLKLIRDKGNLDQTDPYGDTALHRAARRGNLAVVKWLLNQSVSIDAAGKHRRTPLMLAVYSRNDAVVEQLLQHGARLDARDVNHATVLHLAFMGKFEGMVASEPPHGTEPSLETLNSDPILKADLKCGLPGLSNIVKMLLEAGADLEAKNAMDETPLARAALDGSTSAVRLLLEKGANVEPRDKFGYVPLLWAACLGHTAVVCLLLEYGASIDSAKADGDTAVILAANNGHHETISSLLAKSAEINRVNNAQRTALSCAAKNGHDKVVEILLQNGAEVDMPDRAGRTPLLWAVQRGHERCVELLVKARADVTRGDIKGRTPLGWALNGNQGSLQKSRDAVIRILYDRHPASSSLLSTKHASS